MEKVLIVNDCKLESEILKKLLVDLGKTVGTTDEYKTVQKIKEFQPAIMIVNLILEKTTGDKLIKAIKKKYPGVKCILSSSNDITLANYQDKKVDAVLQTPTEKETLQSTLESLEPTTKQQTPESEFSFCPYCGHELTKNYNFCPGCGENL